MLKASIIKRILPFLLILSVFPSLAGCALRPGAVRTENGGKLYRIGFPGEPGSLNPYEADTDMGEMALALLYDTLFTVDLETGENTGSLCADYSVTDSAAGGRLWRLSLRADSFWNDGEPVTASDVEFSLQSQGWFSALYSGRISELIDTVGISVDSNTELAFVAWGSDLEVLDILTRVPVLPRHIWNEADGMHFDSRGLPEDMALAAESLSAAPVNAETMISSGPFAWDSASENSLYLVRQNREEAPSDADAVELIGGLTDPAGALAENRVDAIFDAPLTDLGTWDVNEGYYTAEGNAGYVYLLEFNLLPDGSECLKASDFRKAVSLAAERTRIMGQLQGASFGAAADAEKAGTLLDGCGYTDADGDGLRNDNDGNIRLSLVIPAEASGWEKAAEILAENLSDIGLSVEIRPLSPEEREECIARGDYDLLLTAVAEDRLFSLFYGYEGNNALTRQDASGRSIASGWNECGYASAAFDALYEKRSTAHDGETFRSVTDSMTELLQSDSAFVLLGSALHRQRASSVWRGYTADAGGLLLNSQTIKNQILHLITR